MEDFRVDWAAVSIAAILNMILGFVWYSKWLFAELACVKKGFVGNQMISFLLGLLNSFVIAFFLAFFEGYLDVTTVSDGMFVGFALWLGFVATTQIAPVILQNRPFKLFLIDTSYKLLSLLVMSGIIGA
jgi:hypothetical protein